MRTPAGRRSADAIAGVRRREYPASPDGIFLNAASWGIIPRTAAEEAAGLILRRNRTHGFEESELGVIQRRCRHAVARLIGANAGDVGLAPNTSFGVNLAASLLRAGPRGTIVVSEGEFPANVLPFKALEPDGFSVRIVPCDGTGLPDEPRLIAALDDPDVVALAISAVQFSTGYQADLQRLGVECRARDVYFFVDAIQAIGATPFRADTIGAHLVACGGQKWLCAPWGSGFVWIDEEVRERMDPPMVSWLATRDGSNFADMLHYRMEWRANARKFELATLGIQDYLGLARSIEVIEEIGVAAVREHIHGLHDRVLDWIDARPEVRCVTPADPARRAGIIAFAPDAPGPAAEALRARNVVFSVREGLVRLAPHFYNTVAEIDEVIALLDAAI